MTQIEPIVKKIYEQAKKLGSCDLFKGTEDFERLVRLFLTTQGIEFCLKNHFPNLSTFRLLKGFGAEKYNIYIDAGNISLKNVSRVILIGRSTANLIYDNLDCRYEVIMLHGAKAVVNARQWSVVTVTATTGCVCVKNVSENAIIL